MYTIENIEQSLTENQLLYKSNSLLEQMLRNKQKLEKKVESNDNKMGKLNESLSELLDYDSIKEDWQEPSEDFELFYGYNVVDVIRTYKLLEIENKALKTQIDLLREAIKEEKETIKSFKSKESLNDENISSEDELFDENENISSEEE